MRLQWRNLLCTYQIINISSGIKCGIFYKRVPVIEHQVIKTYRDEKLGFVRS